MNSLEIVLDDERWSKMDGFSAWEVSISDLLNETIQNVYIGQKSFIVNLLLSDEKQLMALNKNFKNKETSTNVLSFPQIDTSDVCKIDTSFKENDIFLGDIAMSYDDIMRESLEFNISFFNRCSHLLVHGVLHLFGMDHHSEIDREGMENLEISILQRHGLSNPYEFTEKQENMIG